MVISFGVVLLIGIRGGGVGGVNILFSSFFLIPCPRVVFLQDESKLMQSYIKKDFIFNCTIFS